MGVGGGSESAGLEEGKGQGKQYEYAISAAE